MKTLTKVKIINWHYFWNETINFEQINFLTGLNASGKSTLIDAMQVVLLGDTTGRFFNKAAMDKSNRTLKGYLRGELGDNLDGGFHYLRNGRFSSYIALEFYDDKRSAHFTLGIVFDSFEDGSQDHRFFHLQHKIPDNEFIVDKVPMDFKTLAAFFNQNYPQAFTFFDSNRGFQDFLKRSFGGLKDKYFSLLKKSISFTPITDITTFITEYVCDPQQNVDIIPMQENILQYRKLENEALIMKARVERLNEISSTYKMYTDHRANMALFSYIVEKAGFQNDKNRLESYYTQMENAKKRLIDIDVDIAEVENSIADFNRRKMRLIQDKAASDTYRLTDELREQQAVTEGKLKSLRSEAEAVKNNLHRYVANFSTIAQSLVDALSEFDQTRLDESLADDVVLLQRAALEVLNSSLHLRDQGLNDIASLDANLLLTWRDHLTTFKQRVSGLALSLGKIITSYDQKVALYKQQELDLRQGGKSYEWKLSEIRRELQSTLSARHNKNVEVMIFADLIDIKSPKWVNAIEGYLYNQKFNLFVDPAYYMEAYQILRDLLDKNNYYGTTLVDQERIIERNYQADALSLATEIKTDHIGAQAYTNFLIGRLIKADNVTQARATGNGITADGDLYRNFSFGKINPRLYREHFIGRQVGEEQIALKRAEVAKHETLVSGLKKLFGYINDANRLEIINSNEITTITNSLNNLKQIPGLESNLVYLASELEKHDLSQLESLQKRIDLIDEDIRSLTNQKDGYLEEKGKLNNSIEMLRNEKIPLEKKNVEERESRLLNNYDPFLIAEQGAPRFEAELAAGKTPLEIITEYNVMFGHAQYLVNNLFSQLAKLRKDYVRDYRLTYDTDREDNGLYDSELSDLQEVKLPAYEHKIHDAYERAVKQFKNDFISKLRSAIETVEDQIDELNFALSASTFGNDSYQFTVRPSSTYRVYYDMITDDLLLEIDEDDSAFLQKYDTVMKDLFAQVALAGDATNNATVLANVEKFTDYRSYLDFDLVVKDKAGHEQRLSKMIKKKSGGETQTPFYIAVLASFAQLYHTQDQGELANTIRLIIFDEAFSKMDGGRIKESIKLLRKFGLQAIVSAPSDKVAEISELVDTTLVVLRGRNASHVRLYAEESKLTTN